MAVSITVNGNSSGEGFLVAPLGTTKFPVTIAIKATGGYTANGKLEVVPSDAPVKLSKTDIAIGAKQATATITATGVSKKAGDVVLQLKVGNSVKAKFILTCITNPRLRFQGRFQARFATDGDFFNEPRGTGNGWTWALEGEPDFVPPPPNVPTAPGMAVGRVVRFQNAVAPRPHVAPIGVTVIAIEAELGSGLVKKTVSFPAGDPIIGSQVSLGPNTYLASNEPSNPADPPPFENYPPGMEPMENFELHIGANGFSGKPAALNDRPKSINFSALTPAEIAQYGIVPLNTFNNTRKAELLNDYHALSPAQRTNTPAGRNLAKRISHLGGSPPDNIPPSQGTLPLGWSGKEIYSGVLNSGISITPGRSIVLSYLKLYKSFRYTGTLFNFHSDELCGRIDGTLQAITRELLRMPSAFQPNK
ncbi:MAG TPA: hypothetical protein VJT82_07380 [Pyrinomonadaceae bacterium]|nr:hypothetical protein [Pyrinomonadaceae bacterium]